MRGYARGHGKPKVTYDNGNHAQPVLPPSEESGKQEDTDRDWNGGDGEVEFVVSILVANYDNELDGEAEEEEKVELQKCNVNLVDQLARSSLQEWTRVRRT